MPRNYFNRGGRRSWGGKSRRGYGGRKQGGFKRRKTGAQRAIPVGQPKYRARPQYQLSTGQSPFPDQVKTKLKYVQTFSAACVSGVPAYNIFRGNSCFDPDLTGAGHQPLFYDQYAAIYQYQRVYGSRITIRPHQTISSGTNQAAAFTVILPSLSSSTAVIGQLEEQPWCKIDLLTNVNINNKFVHYMSTSKIFGVDPMAIQMDQSAYTCSVITNPNDQWYWEVLYGNIDAGSSSTATIIVEIDYYVEFYGRTQVGQS